MAQPEAISWSTAQRVATRVSRDEPFSSSYLSASLESDFSELTRQAEAIVEQQTGLRADGPARIQVVDRDGWVGANVASFQRMLRPLTERFAPRMNDRLLAPLSRRATGTQLGLVLGWMSGRVLGQYDLLLIEDDRPEDQDFVYYVGPNVLAMEKRYAFPPREFRLWLAVHECTHRAQFTGVPWMADYFRTQVNSILSDVEADPKRLQDSVRRLAEQVKAGDKPAKEGGMLALFASPEQQQTIKRIYALMALLEGHGDVTMSSAKIPSGDRFHRVLHERRKSAAGFARVMQRLLGLEAKMKQYAEGEKFIRAVREAENDEFFRRVWTSPQTLPSYDEIRDPSLWVTRMRDA